MTAEVNTQEDLKMRPLKRKTVHKGKSARHFKHNVKRTKAANLSGPMRGGIRL